MGQSTSVNIASPQMTASTIQSALLSSITVTSSTLRQSSATETPSSTVVSTSSGSAPRSTSADDDDGRLVAIIVGSILGAVIVGLLLLLAFLCLFPRRCRRRRKQAGLLGIPEVAGLVDDENKYTQVDTSYHNDATGETANLPTDQPMWITHSMHGRHHNPFASALRRSTAAALSQTSIAPSKDGTTTETSYLADDAHVHPAYRGLPQEPGNMVHPKNRRTSSIPNAILSGAGYEELRDGREPYRASAQPTPERSREQSRHSLKRKPVSSSSLSEKLPVDAESVGGNRASLDGRQSCDSSKTPGRTHAYERHSPFLRQQGKREKDEANEALLGGTWEFQPDPKSPAYFGLQPPGKSTEIADRPPLYRNDTSDAELLGRNGQHTYQAYQPGVSNEPFGPSRPSSEVSTREGTPKSLIRKSISSQTPTRPENALKIHSTRSHEVVRDSNRSQDIAYTGVRSVLTNDEIPAMWRASTERPVKLAKQGGQPLYDATRRTVPIPQAQNLMTRSGTEGRVSTLSEPSNLNRGTVQGIPPVSKRSVPAFAARPVQQTTRRISLSDLIEDERRKEEARRRQAQLNNRSDVGIPQEGQIGWAL